MNRRGFLTTLGILSLGGCVGMRYWPDEGIWNDCIDGSLPKSLANHELMHTAWEGLDATKVWDCHTHLIGTGDSGNGIWVNPNMETLWHHRLLNGSDYPLPGVMPVFSMQSFVNFRLLSFNVFRIDSKRISSACATPPPTTIFSGFRRLITLDKAMPIQ